MMNYYSDLATVYSSEGAHGAGTISASSGPETWVDVDVEQLEFDDPLLLAAEEQDNELEEQQQDDDEEEEDPRYTTLPRILFMGPRRSGKTSIQRVVFQKMSPHETLFRLEATQHIERTIVDHTALCRFTIWDFPGDYYGGYNQQQHQQQQQYPYFMSSSNSSPEETNTYPTYHDYEQPYMHGSNDTKLSTAAGMIDLSSSPPAAFVSNTDIAIYSTATALVFVMDAQDEPYDHVLQNFIFTISRAVAVSPNIAIEVFINKVDGELFLSDEAKYDCRRDIKQQVTDELADAQLDHLVSVNYHLVSIYDHSIFEALSRVVQKVIPQLQPTLENLLNLLVGSCAMEKAYLFDVASKLYISTDSSPVDMQTVELCSDMIDVVLDVSGIYGAHLARSRSKPSKLRKQGRGGEGEGGDHKESYTSVVAGGGRVPTQVVAVESTTTGEEEAAVDSLAQSPMEREKPRMKPLDNGGNTDDNDREEEEEEDEEEPLESSAFDEQSSSVIRLSNGMVLYLREVDTMLALVCLIRSENFRKKSLINYNIGCLKHALKNLVVVLPEDENEEKKVE